MLECLQCYALECHECSWLSPLRMPQRSITDSYTGVGWREYDKCIWQRDTSSLKVVKNNNWPSYLFLRWAWEWVVKTILWLQVKMKRKDVKKIIVTNMTRQNVTLCDYLWWADVRICWIGNNLVSWPLTNRYITPLNYCEPQHWHVSSLSGHGISVDQPGRRCPSLSFVWWWHGDMALLSSLFGWLVAVEWWLQAPGGGGWWWQWWQRWWWWLKRKQFVCWWSTCDVFGNHCYNKIYIRIWTYYPLRS